MGFKALEYSCKDDQKSFLKWEKQIMKFYSDSLIIFFLIWTMSLEQYTQKYWALLPNTGIVGAFIFLFFTCIIFLQNERHIMYYLC